MDEYIKKHDAVRLLVHDTAYAAANIVEDIPAENVAPVIEGYWEKEPVEFWPVPDYKCSSCGAYAIVDSKGHQVLSNFCPVCGAKMDKEDSYE